MRTTFLAVEWSYSVSDATDHDSDRRDFLYFTTAGAVAVAAGAAVVPLAHQMNPSADVRAMSSIRVDVSGVAPGTQISVLFLGKPIFIRRRTQAEIDEARAVDLSVLPDPVARNENLAGDTPGNDANRTVAPFGGEDTGEWLVMQGVCTHLGCVPLGDAGDFGGWFCPCHGSHYDTSGRIRKGPAPTNLPIPVAVFEDETTLKLG
jgi:ubiquinol-cytochrome c reductase iron-sulfur subunit